MSEQDPNVAQTEAHDEEMPHAESNIDEQKQETAALTEEEKKAKQLRLKATIQEIMKELTSSNYQNIWSTNRLSPNHYLSDASAGPSSGLDKKEALMIAIKLAKEPDFCLKKEHEPKTLLTKDELTKIHNSLTEESKEMSHEEITTTMKRVFSDPISLAQSFQPAEKEISKSLETLPSEFDSRTGSILASLSSLPEFGEILEVGLQGLTDYVEAEKRMTAPLINRFFLLFLGNEAHFDPSYIHVVMQACALFAQFEFPYSSGHDWFKNTDLQLLTTTVKVLQQDLTFTLLNDDDPEPEEAQAFFPLMNYLYGGNQTRNPRKRVDFKEFNNDVINSEREKELPDHYIRWFKRENDIPQSDEEEEEANNLLQQFFNNGQPPAPKPKKPKRTFFMMDFPWIFDAGAKSKIMRIEAKIAQRDEQREHMMMGVAHPSSLYLIVKIDRHNVIEDALNSLVNQHQSLRKPLKVIFEGEAGVDEGGVQKEFFQILIRDLFDPSFGMFQYNEEQRNYWIKGDSFCSPMQFELIGILLGLAIFNGVILDVHLPKACYKRLLDEEPDLEDLIAYDPKIGNSMKALLENESPNLEDELYLTFTYEYESWGEQRVDELKPNGKNIYVSQENKHEYVALFIDYIFNKSVEKFWKNFYEGFHKVCHGDILNLCQPDELELLICGSTVLDFNALRRSTRHQDGYDEDSPAVKMFWEVVEEFDNEEKKKLLMFCTGCDRAPINGLGSLKFYISRHGDDESKLPSAHTCFNHLLLPEYSDIETMRSKLKQAIENSEGFGLI